MDLLVLPSKETVEKIRNLAGVDEKHIKEAVKILTEWLQLQPHLPHQYEEARMERLFLRCKTSIERSKENLNIYYTVKTAIPEIFSNRDPLQPWFTEISKLSCFVLLPKLTEEYDRVAIMSFFDPDPDKFVVYDLVKLCTMVMDIGYMEDYHSSNILLIDYNNFSPSYLLQYTPPFLKKLEVTIMKGYKARMKAIHMLNVPTYVDTTVQLFKSFVKPDLANRIHTHRKGSNSLPDLVSPEILPKEYGGNAGSIHDLWDGWKKKVESYRSWFLEQEHLKSDESKRPGKGLNCNDLFGFEGSFRKLSVD